MMNITTMVPRRRVQGMGQLMLYEASDTFDNVNLLTYWTIHNENWDFQNALPTLGIKYAGFSFSCGH